jgi:hypothetical protein
MIFRPRSRLSCLQHSTPSKRRPLIAFIGNPPPCAGKPRSAPSPHLAADRVRCATLSVINAPSSAEGFLSTPSRDSSGGDRPTGERIDPAGRLTDPGPLLPAGSVILVPPPVRQGNGLRWGLGCRQWVWDQRQPDSCYLSLDPLCIPALPFAWPLGGAATSRHLTRTPLGTTEPRSYRRTGRSRATNGGAL